MRTREHVPVVGGGVAGLALAAALDPRRVHVTLVEERPERAGAGTVLAMWRSGRVALDDLGVGERTRSASLPADRAVLRDAAGRDLHDIAPSLWFTPRAELMAALEAALPPSVSRLTQQVTDPRALATQLGADLVVGADGVRSAVRQHARAGTAPVVTDWIGCAGTCPDRPSAPPPSGGGRAVSSARRRDRRVPRGSARCAVAVAPPWTRPRHSPPARGHFADWDPRTREVLAAVGGRADAQRILLAPRLRTSADDRLVLIGDAAHAMSPNLGRGANEALEDALALAAMVHRHGTKGAPRAFSRRRHLRGQVLRTAASIGLRAATTRRAAPARDALLRAAGSLS
uniref:FAD-dependent monooxygenase n=1 Tax=Janibacter limosus TaxID=53458 RepID=A0AC61U3N5_9MICO|nr:FAD-dependent monooxygenase [Janibacter limosus]